MPDNFQISFNDGLLDFLARSPTPFHATANMAAMLREAGFVKLSESDEWDLIRGQSYYVTRNDSSIVAFTLSGEDVMKHGLRMMGAHTDSPCLKVKPVPDLNKTAGYLQLGVEVYGGALLSPWFDRDLSIAGRVSYITKFQQMRSDLIDFIRPVALIPSLAIHLDREVNEKRSINAQTQMPPIVLQHTGDEAQNFTDVVINQLQNQYPDCNIGEVLDFELFLYDTQPPAVVGINEDFICSARLDNLLSCYVGLKSLLSSNKKMTSLLVCSDHEEVGSMSATGAQGPFLESVLRRIAETEDRYTRLVHRSLMFSVDNAHGIHPNFSDKHDDNHGPVLNNGPVIKVNANQRYATNSETSALFKALCRKANVPVQSFAMRSDMACGSTIGPITASALGVPTLDIGIAQFAMHSIRETIGVMDPYYLHTVLVDYINELTDLEQMR